MKRIIINSIFTRVNLLLLISWLALCTVGVLADVPLMAGANGGHLENYPHMKTLGLGMVRIGTNQYWDKTKANPESLDKEVLAALKNGIEPLILFEYYTRFGMKRSGEQFDLGGYDRWKEIGRAFAERFSPNSSWLLSNGIKNIGVRTYTALNEPYWQANNWRPYTMEEYRDVMKGMADGVHSVNKNLKAMPAGYIPVFWTTTTKVRENMEIGQVKLQSGSKEISVDFDFGLKEKLKGEIRFSIGLTFDKGTVWSGGLQCDSNVDKQFQHLTKTFTLPEGATELRILELSFIQKYPHQVKQHSSAYLDNVVMKTENGSIYSEDFEDQAHNFFYNAPKIVSTSGPVMPSGAIGKYVGNFDVPTHVLHSIVDLLNDGTLDGIDIHTYWNDVTTVSDKLKNTQQYRYDLIKSDYGITRDIPFYTTEYNANHDDENIAAKSWLTLFWDVMGVRGSKGQYVVTTAMPFDLFILRNPSNSFAMSFGMTEKTSPWTPSVRGKLFQRLLLLTKGLDFVPFFSKGTGQHLLTGNNKSLWVYTNAQNWAEKPGTSYLVKPIPNGASTLEIHDWQGLQKSVSVAGKSEYLVTGLRIEETYMFLVKAAVPTKIDKNKVNGYSLNSTATDKLNRILPIWSYVIKGKNWSILGESK